MNHIHHYNLLIDKAKNRKLAKDEYKERHHIIPKCMGGDNSPENIVELTAKEHYIAHLLLAYAYPDNHKLVFAFNMMRVGGKAYGRNTSRRHAHLREELSKALKAMPRPKWSEEAKAKQSKRLMGKNNPMYGRRGKDHPAHGLGPWRYHISLPNNSDWRYSYLFYDVIQAERKMNPFNKKIGHKRVLQMLNKTESDITTARTIVDKINGGFNPYESDDLALFCSDKEIPSIDLTQFDYHPMYKYAFEIYDWHIDTKKKTGRNNRQTSLFKHKPHLLQKDIARSNFVYLLEVIIQQKEWNPYEDNDFMIWYDTWA